VIVERDEAGWYVASVPELRGCHTQAKRLDDVLERVREAIGACIEGEGKTTASEFVAVTRVTVGA
jgi:predicted RNase H-like HicB family nuclease